MLSRDRIGRVNIYYVEKRRKSSCRKRNCLALAPKELTTLLGVASYFIFLQVVRRIQRNTNLCQSQLLLHFRSRSRSIFAFHYLLSLDSDNPAPRLPTIARNSFHRTSLSFQVLLFRSDFPSSSLLSLPFLNRIIIHPIIPIRMPVMIYFSLTGSPKPFRIMMKATMIKMAEVFMLSCY